MPTWGYLGPQDNASPPMEQLAYSHDHTMFTPILTTTLVAYTLINPALNSLIDWFYLKPSNWNYLNYFTYCHPDLHRYTFTMVTLFIGQT